MRSKFFVFGLALVSSISLSFADDGCDYGICLGKIGGFINSLNSTVVAAFGTLFLAVAVVGFFLGVVRFIWAQQQGEEKGIKAGKETLKWGLIALFCAFSVYGIIRFGQSVFFGANADDVTKIKVPKFIIDPTSPSTSGQTNGPGPTNGPNGPGPTNGPNGPGPTNGPNGPNGPGPTNGPNGARTSLSGDGNRTSAAAGVIANSSGSFPFNFSTGLNGDTILTGIFDPSKQTSKQENAKNLYDVCIKNRGNSTACANAYKALGGQGDPSAQNRNTSSSFNYDACISSGRTKAECQLRVDAAAMGVPVDMPTQNPAPQETYYNYTPQEETYYNYIPADQGSGNSTEETYDYGGGSNNSADETYYNYRPSGGDDGGSGQSADYANTDPDYTP